MAPDDETTPREDGRGKVPAAGDGDPRDEKNEEKDPVDEASDESFPASDPPAFNPAPIADRG